MTLELRWLPRVAASAEDRRREADADELRFRTLFEPFGVGRETLAPPREPRARRVVGLVSGRVVAYGVLIADGAVAQVRQVCVAEDVRRRGVGAELMRGLEREAARDGVRLLWLDARVPFADFYRSLGYEVTSGTYHVGATDVPHVRMEKPVEYG